MNNSYHLCMWFSNCYQCIWDLVRNWPTNISWCWNFETVFSIGHWFDSWSWQQKLSTCLVNQPKSKVWNYDVWLIIKRANKEFWGFKATLFVNIELKKCSKKYHLDLGKIDVLEHSYVISQEIKLLLNSRSAGPICPFELIYVVAKYLYFA